MKNELDYIMYIRPLCYYNYYVVVVVEVWGTDPWLSSIWAEPITTFTMIAVSMPSTASLRNLAKGYPSICSGRHRMLAMINQYSRNRVSIVFLRSISIRHVRRLSASTAKTAVQT